MSMDLGPKANVKPLKYSLSVGHSVTQSSAVSILVATMSNEGKFVIELSVQNPSQVSFPKSPKSTTNCTGAKSTPNDRALTWIGK